MAGLTIAVLASACARFTPAMPMRARSGDVELQLEHLRTGGLSRELVFASNSGVPHAIKRGWITVATRDPCSGGADVDRIDIDRGAIRDGVLPAGSHELSVWFGDNNVGDYSLDVVVDLEVEEGGCLRAPAISQVIPLTAEKRFVFVTGISLVGNSDIAGFRGVFEGNAGGGGWLGPVLLTAQLGVGASLCNEATCGKDADGNLKSDVTVPFSIDARYAFGTASVNRLYSIGMVGARYAFIPVRLPALDGDRHFFAHGLQGLVAWGFGDNLKGPFRHLERAGVYEFAVPFGVLVYPGGSNERVAFATGLEMRVFFQL